jgi:hypothetical protein
MSDHIEERAGVCGTVELKAVRAQGKTWDSGEAHGRLRTLLRRRLKNDEREYERGEDGREDNLGR